jgi:hypothetical protein
MRIEIFINGDKYFSQTDTFSKAILKAIADSIQYKRNQELHQTKAKEITTLIEICEKDELVFVMDKHLTLDVEFVNKLRLFDTIHCTCLKPKTEIGKVIRELMINDYELVLIRRVWVEPNYLKLDFEAVDYGEACSFLPEMMKGNF